MPFRRRARRVEAAAPSPLAAAVASPGDIGGDVGVAHRPASGASVSRDVAMSVPAVIAARNLIAGTLGTMELDRYRGTTILPADVIATQPDPGLARSVTYAVDRRGRASTRSVDVHHSGARLVRVPDPDPASAARIGRVRTDPSRRTAIK